MLIPVHSLREALKSELPGWEAHRKVIPGERLDGLNQIPSDAKQSSVLVLLYPVAGEICTLLMLRPDYDGVHGGQVSFPGGSLYTGESPVEAALREAREETGVDTGKVEVAGCLTSLFIPPSRFVVTPVVGVAQESLSFVPDKREVQRLAEVPLAGLLGDKNLCEKEIRTRSGAVFVTPYYNVCGLTVWGATAMIIREFSEVCASAGISGSL